MMCGLYGTGGDGGSSARLSGAQYRGRWANCIQIFGNSSKLMAGLSIWIGPPLDQGYFYHNNV